MLDAVIHSLAPRGYEQRLGETGVSPEPMNAVQKMGRSKRFYTTVFESSSVPSTSSVPPQGRVVLAASGLRLGAASGPGLGAAWERAQQPRLQEQGGEEDDEEKVEGARRGERQPCGGSWRW
jgi:hypothetical protein